VHGHPHDPEQWTPALLRDYVVHLIDGTTLAPASVTSKVQSLLAFTRWLHVEGYTSSNVGERVKKPPLPQVQKTPFSDDELRALLAAAKASSPRDYVIVCLLIDCGLRAGELTSLTVENVLLHQNVLMVHGKGRRDRVVPISPQSSRAISRYLQERQRRRGDQGVYLIESRSAGPLSPNSLLQVVKRLGRDANVAHVHPHRFRHTFAAGFLRNGGDPFSLQRLLGHTTLAMTNRYVAMSTEDLRRTHGHASPLTQLLKKNSK
jgi:site-specific recombinase XerD